MVPDKFNMVDMGGIDLIMMQGETVPDLYQRLVESIAQCRYQCLYNWMFDGIQIPPTYVIMEIDEETGDVVINEGIQVTDEDIVKIYSLEILPTLTDLVAQSNGEYLPASGTDGFRSVVVEVPPPVLQSLEVVENGTYQPGQGVDGFNSVSVTVPSPPLTTLEATENGIYTPPSGVYGFSSVEVDVSASSSDEFTYAQYTPTGTPLNLDWSATIVTPGTYLIAAQFFGNTMDAYLNNIALPKSINLGGYYTYVVNVTRTLAAGDVVRVTTTGQGGNSVMVIVKLI